MTESVLDYMTRLGRAARAASRVLARASTAQKNHALQAAANALDAARSELTAANELDLAAARANGLEPQEMIATISSRLIVNKASMKMQHARIQALIETLREAVEAHQHA